MPSGPAGAPDSADPLRGVLGAILGESTADQKARIAEATKNANDLSGLVKKKKPAAVAAQPAPPQQAEKRKLEDVAEEGETKKAKVEGGSA